MNKKVFRVMLTLVITFLLGLYILKIFYPQQFMLSIQNETIVSIGKFIDDHIWLRYIIEAITAFILYWLYCCASAGKKYLKWYECLEILATIIIVRVVSIFDVNISTAISFASFVFLPALTGGNMRNTAIVCTTHFLAQTLSLSIRNLIMYLTDVNYLTTLIMGIECYLWLILFYGLFNYKGKNKEV